MYTRVESRFWNDERMRAVSSDARHLMLYLMTTPHRNILGLYFLPTPYACFDLGWDEQRYRKGLQELLQTGRVKHDDSVYVVLVVNYLKHNPLENPNQVKSAIEKLNELPETSLFKSLLGIMSEFNKPFLEPLRQRLKERFPQPGTGTGTGTVTENNNSAPDGADVSENAPAEKPQNGGAQTEKSGKGDEYTSDFEAFWRIYPRNKEKTAAFRVWKARLKDGHTAKEMIVAARNYAIECKQKRVSIEYIKHAKTFLGPTKAFLEYLKEQPPDQPIDQEDNKRKALIKKLYLT